MSLKICLVLTDKTKLEELIQLNEKIFSSEKEILEQRITEIIQETENEKTKLKNGIIIYKYQ